MTYPLKSSNNQMSNAVRSHYDIIKNEMTDEEFRQFNRIITSKKQSLNSNKYRKNYSHNAIITSVSNFNDLSTIDKKDPDLYVFGGNPGSGKTSTLGKFVPEKTIVIDTDAYRGELAKHHKSPMKNYKMAHSGYLQKESKKITNKAIKRALKESRDITFDTTFGNKKRVNNIIKEAKKRGYDVHLLATQMKPHNSIKSSTKRFLRSGRYVPANMILAEGNEVNEIIWNERNNSKYHSVKIRDTDAIVDKKKKVKTVFKRGNIRKNYNNPKQRK
jgi:predicted ABC-type ATPase